MTLRLFGHNYHILLEHVAVECSPPLYVCFVLVLAFLGIKAKVLFCHRLPVVTMLMQLEHLYSSVEHTPSLNCGTQIHIELSRVKYSLK